MNITRENYPRYFLDYYEGRLSEEGRGELMGFLERHPDLGEEFGSFEMVHLDAEKEILFPGKESLKRADVEGDSFESGRKTFLCDAIPDELFLADVDGALRVNPEHYEIALVAFVEGDLNKEEEGAVREFVAGDARYGRELDLMRAARVEPETSVAYPRKLALKRHAIGPALQRWSYAASVAAAVMLMAVLMWHFVPEHTAPVFTQDIPAETGRERPEAVAEAPGLQQAGALTPIPPQPIPPISSPGITQTSWAGRLASLHESDIPPSSLQDLPPHEDSPGEMLPARSVLASHMQTVPPQTLSVSAYGHHAAPEARREYYWFAYRDRSDMLAGRGGEPAGDPDPPQTSLARLARMEVTELAGLELAFTEELASADASTIGAYARRGLGSINNLLGQPVVVDGESKSDGRIVQFAIGSFFEVSKTGD